jgi:hypothetical protein
MLSELQNRSAVESLKFTLQRRAPADQSEGRKSCRVLQGLSLCDFQPRNIYSCTNILFLSFALLECIALARRFISVHQQIHSNSSAHYATWQEAFLSRLHLHLHQSQQCKVSHRNSTIHHSNLHVEAAVVPALSLEVEVVLDVVAVEDRAILTLNHSATIRVQHSVKDLEVPILEKDTMHQLRGRPHEGTLILRR